MESRFDRSRMRFKPAALLFCVLLAACAAPQPPPVYLENANVLPLQLDDRFQFRKQQLFFNDPRAYVITASDTIRFLRLQKNYGAITSTDLDEVTGYSYSFFWRTSQRADVTVRFEYRQAALGNFVMAQERYYTDARGSFQSDFEVTGDEYFENGKVLAWRVLLIVDGNIVAFRQSFMWK